MVHRAFHLQQGRGISFLFDESTGIPNKRFTRNPNHEIINLTGGPRVTSPFTSKDIIYYAESCQVGAQDIRRSEMKQTKSVQY